MGITLSTIKADATNQQVYQRGEQYFQLNAIQNVHCIQRADWERVHAQVRGSGEKLYQASIELNEHGDVMGYFCECMAFQEYPGACKHLVALMLYVMAWQKEQERIKVSEFKSKKASGGNQSAPTDFKLVELIRSRISQTMKSLQTEDVAPTVSLEPRIELTYQDELTLSFTIGRQRQYVIKDLVQFYEDMQSHREVTYGKELTFRHDTASFDEASKPILRFLLDKCSENVAHRQTRYYEGGSRRILFVSPRGMDELFDLSMGNPISIKPYNKERQMAALIEEVPKFEVKISEHADFFSMQINLHGVKLIRGERFLYVFKDNALYRCDEAGTQRLTDLLTIAKQSKHPLIINKQDMGIFSTSILDDIREYIELTGDYDVIEAYRPMPLHARVYFDMPKTDVVTARIEYHYGNRVLKAYDEQEGSTDIQRNWHSELLLQKKLEQYFEVSQHDKQTIITCRNEVRIFELLMHGMDEISELAEIYVSDVLKKAGIRKSPALSVGVGLQSDLLSIQFDAEDFPLSELMGVLTSYRLKKRYHKLKDGSFLDLRNTSLADFSELTDGLNLTQSDLQKGHVVVPKYRAMYLDNVIKNSGQIKSERNAAFKAMVRNLRSVADSDFAVPESLKPILRNYQELGYRWLQTMTQYGFGGILADDMGLGKTLQIIAVLLAYRQTQHQKQSSLVTCPASLVLNWEAEIQRFAPELRCITIIGPAAQREAMIAEIGNYDVAVTSYDLLKRDVAKYTAHHFHLHIIDEAQYIKNQNTLNAKTVCAIHAVQRFALTGTPIENRLSEIWSIFNFLMPGYLYTYAQFKRRFEMPIVKNNDQDALNNLNRLIHPFVLRRLKRDVLKELPEKTESVVYAAMEEEQKKLYLANAALAKKEIEERFSEKQPQNGRIMVLALLTRLRQLCCHPALCYQDYTGNSTKLSTCIELIEECIESGHKVLLFSQFTSMLAILERELKQRAVSYYLLKGSTKKETRAHLVEQFNHDATNVFLISLKAGGTGLNLTGADVVIHYDPWWNVSAQNQATDRAHRIGQKNNVQVYKLIAQNTVEDKILKLQQKKQQLADSVIKEGSGGIASMTKSEILALFD